jgi:hypothetical protein
VIVVIDSENKNVKVYTDKGVNKLDFSDLGKLKSIIGNNIALFLESAYEVDYNDLKEMLNIDEDVETAEIEKSNILYIHPKNNNSIRISENLSFYGIEDFKLLSDFANSVEDLAIKNKTLYSLVKQGILEITSDSEAIDRILKDVKEKQSKLDKELDSIIVNTSVSDLMSDIRSGRASDIEEIQVD